MNKHSIQLCVFDMAGTTVDEDNVVYKTVQSAINESGYEVTLKQVLAHGAGKEKKQAIIDVLGAVTNCTNIQDTATAIFTHFQTALDRAYENLTIKAIDGVESVFAQLRAKGIAIILNTGYSRAIATQLLDKLGWQLGEHIDGLITADDVENGRPAPDMILAAMKRVGVVDAKQVLKAGDSIIDIEEGKNAGCGITVGVLSGAQTREQLQTASPTLILNSLAQLPKQLQ